MKLFKTASCADVRVLLSKWPSPTVGPLWGRGLIHTDLGPFSVSANVLFRAVVVLTHGSDRFDRYPVA
eukprot:5335815-Alexandrium_andersonii.AAC.1